MKLSASVIASNLQKTLENIRSLEPFGADYWHIDCLDDLNIFSTLEEVHRISSVAIDLHLITDRPEQYIEKLHSSSIRRLSIQIENVRDGFKFIPIEGIRSGMAIHISNPHREELIAEYMDQIDHVLLMMTTPGKSGGKFNSGDFRSIQTLIHRFPTIEWCIDGGVNHEISYILRLMGVDMVVVGSYLTGHENIASAFLQIQSRRVRSDFKVSEYMLSPDTLPLVQSSSSVMEMLEELDRGKLGAAFVVDRSQKLLGIVSNADLRKTIISKKFHYEMPLTHMMNPNPIYIEEGATTSEMLDLIDLTKFPILVLPVLDKFETLKGAISFHPLLKDD